MAIWSSWGEGGGRVRVSYERVGVSVVLMCEERREKSNRVGDVYQNQVLGSM